jgi:hypothetical protein
VKLDDRRQSIVDFRASDTSQELARGMLLAGMLVLRKPTRKAILLDFRTAREEIRRSTKAAAPRLGGEPRTKAALDRAEPHKIGISAGSRHESVCRVGARNILVTSGKNAKSRRSSINPKALLAFGAEHDF